MPARHRLSSGFDAHEPVGRMASGSGCPTGTPSPTRAPKSGKSLADSGEGVILPTAPHKSQRSV
ncbi:MAG: hypothetical protein MUC60_18220 [Oscillatoria sp. Prado101]|nr:hypothetical protein [Oscillatoria sp. Prado101]